MGNVIRRYSNGEVTVVWEPARCVHSGVCFRGLPQVFDPRKRPWVNIEGAPSAEIVAQVGRCPSGALSMAGSNPAAAPPVPADVPPSERFARDPAEE